jgi:hypothetical protein
MRFQALGGAVVSGWKQSAEMKVLYSDVEMSANAHHGGRGHEHVQKTR